MRRTCSLLFSIAVGALAFAASNGSASAESFTTRIETKPYYGAVVTIEHGVHVYRPLPPDRFVIINPDRVPLNLSYSDTRIYGYGGGAPYVGGGVPRGQAYGGDGIYYAPVGGPFFARRPGRFRGHLPGRVSQWHPGFYHINGAPRGLLPGSRNGAGQGSPGAIGPAH